MQCNGLAWTSLYCGDVVFTIGIVGDPGAGKTSFAACWKYAILPPVRISGFGCRLYKRNFPFDGDSKRLKILLWDVPSCKRKLFMYMRRLKSADVVFVLYDPSGKSGIAATSFWLSAIESSRSSDAGVPVVVVAVDRGKTNATYVAKDSVVALERRCGYARICLNSSPFHARKLVAEVYKQQHRTSAYKQ